MRRLRALLARLLHAQRAKDDFNAELESHIALHTEECVRAGMSAAEARRVALLRLGGAEQARQHYRERAGLPWLETLIQDVRYALRGFRRTPLFAVTAILTLALGIGATTAVFSVVDRILFRSLPYAQDDRLVSVGLSQPLQKDEFTLGGFFYEWRANQKPFTALTFERGVDACNLTEARPAALSCASVAQDFLPTLGVRLVLGRNFTAEEDAVHGPKAALLSYGLWQDRFNRNPNVLNQSISIDDEQYRVVGVLPRDFEMPRLQPADIVLAAQMDLAAQHTVNNGIGAPMWAFARLKPGVSVRAAQEQMEPLFRHTQQWIPAQFRNDFHLQVRSVRDRQMHDAYRAAWVLLGAVLTVLLIACANVASLFSARGAARERELAVRAALGASRGRLMRQTMTESLLLAVFATLAGYALAEGLLRIFIAIAPTGIPFIAEARLDLRIVGFTTLLALVCTLLFGMAPALEKPRTAALGARATASMASARLRRVLVVTQIAMTVVLLASAGLLLRSFNHLESQSLGITTHNVLAVRIPLTWQRYPNDQAYMDFNRRAEAALRRVPGVSAVSISDSVPPDATSWHDERGLADVVAVGEPAIPQGTRGRVIVRTVTPEYFRVLHIPLLEGRGFNEQDRAVNTHGIILSKLLAAHLFPNQDALGRHIQFVTYLPYYTLDKQLYTVVGVAADVKNGGLAGEDAPEYYLLRGNWPEAWSRHTVLLMDSAFPASVAAPWIRAQIAQLDPVAPVEVEPLTQTVSRMVDRPRFETALLSFFAVVGLVMAVVGLYGVIAFMAAQRTQEIGVRMALGATRADVLRLIAGEGLRLIALGGALGLGAALALSHVLKSLLFDVSPYDPASYLAGIALLTIVALGATLIPARTAMKVNPMSALRME